MADVRQRLYFELKRDAERSRRLKLAREVRTPAQKQRDWFLSRRWTKKTCCVCGASNPQIHHSSYRLPPRIEPLGRVAWCSLHHEMFEHRIWPIMRQWGVSRLLATLAFTANGERLLRLVEAEQASLQLSLLTPKEDQ